MYTHKPGPPQTTPRHPSLPPSYDYRATNRARSLACARGHGSGIDSAIYIAAFRPRNPRDRGPHRGRNAAEVEIGLAASGRVRGGGGGGERKVVEG